MKTGQRSAAARPGAALEHSQLEPVARDEHRFLNGPCIGIRQLRELSHDARFLRILAAQDHRPSVFERSRPGTARGLRQVWSLSPGRAAEVETIDARGCGRTAASHADAQTEYKPRDVVA